MGASAFSHLVIAHASRIDQLERLVSKLRRAHFGPKPEKAPINQEQLTLRLSGCVIEAQLAAQAEQPQATEDKPARTLRESCTSCASAA